MNQSHITLEQHVRSMLLAAGAAMRKLTKVYLDTNFWVWLRRSGQREAGSSAARLLDALRAGVAQGKLICPLSGSAFMELFKQNDLETRRATAVLMDELSGGYCLLDPRMRMNNEVSNFLHRKVGRSTYDIEELAWCKVSFALGLIHPSVDGPIEPAVLLALQKGVFDEMWNCSLTDIVDSVGSSPVPSLDAMAETAAEMNRRSAKHAHEIRSFQQTHRTELQGVAEDFAMVFLEVGEHLHRESGQAPAGSMGTPSRLAMTVATSAMLYSLQKDIDRDRMPSLQIEAALHASVRWDKQRQLDANDLFDFRHASAALAYCDMFFTEGPLHSTLQQKHIALDQRFNCTVRSTLEDALSALGERGLV